MFDFIKKLNEKIKSLPPEAQKMVKRVNILYKRFEEIVNIEMKLKNLFITDINTPGAKINFNFTYEKVKKINNILDLCEKRKNYISNMLDIIDKKLNEYLIQFYKEYNNQNPVIYSDAMRESFLEHWRNWYKEHIDRFSDFGAKEDREKLFFLFRKYVRLNYRLYVIYQEIKESQMKVKKYPVKNEKKFVECVKTAIKRFKRRMFLSKDKRDEIITQKIDELKDYINNFIKEKRGEKI